MYYENINIGQQWYSKDFHSLKLFSGKYPELWREKQPHLKPVRALNITGHSMTVIKIKPV